MKLYSTNTKSPKVSLKEAVLSGLASDGGLYMPEKIPQMPLEFFRRTPKMSLQEISLEVAKKLLQEDVPPKALEQIIGSALNFDIPLVNLDKHTNSLELFHGPTSAFKDIGARFMARLLSYLVKGEKNEITILVATSGDTGSAVGNGFLNIEGIKVFILYPSKKVSFIQEQQLTTLGNNVTALEIKGTFDDCQGLVKEAFLDKDLKKKFTLTSANSINIARLIPQSFYYFYAYAQICRKDTPVIISVPSGNFGNLTAGLIAKKMGLPISKFIAATNVNDIVPEYLETGLFKPRASIKTLSNAMDVGNPSNFARILELYDQDISKIKSDLIGYSFTDRETRNAIREVFEQKTYLMDPHGAVGYLGLKKFMQVSKEKVDGIFLETAHPAKFKDIVEEIIDQKINIPNNLQKFLRRKKKAIFLSKKFKDLKEFLLDLN